MLFLPMGTETNSACITSILRLYESIINIGSLDVTYSLAPVSLWA